MKSFTGSVWKTSCEERGQKWAAAERGSWWCQVGLFELTSCGESVPWQASAALHAWWYSGIHCIHIEMSKSLLLDSTHCVADGLLAYHLHENTLQYQGSKQ